MPRPMLRTPQNQTQSQTVNNNILSATRNQEHEQQQQQMDYQEVLIYLFQQQKDLKNIWKHCINWMRADTFIIRIK